jgi:hypothetical protein
MTCISLTKHLNAYDILSTVCNTLNTRLINDIGQWADWTSGVKYQNISFLIWLNIWIWQKWLGITIYGIIAISSCEIVAVIILNLHNYI